MTTGSNLKIRGSVYNARQVVPVDLRQHFSSRELVKSLNTKDRRTANARKLAVLTEWQDTFADLRSRREISEADFAQALGSTTPMNCILMTWCGLHRTMLRPSPTLFFNITFERCASTRTRRNRLGSLGG